jgi:cell wall-associated NlpC family hydrolase
MFSCGVSGRMGGIRQLSDSVARRHIPDKRVGVFDADYQLTGKKLTVRGATTSFAAKSELRKELEEQGYQVTDELQLLPDDERLQGKTYAVVNLSVANMRQESRYSSEMTTQALLGMPLRVLQHDGWYRVQTPDNYIGRMNGASMQLMTREEYDAWNRAEKVIVVAQVGFTYEQPDTKSQTVSDVVGGSRLKRERAGEDADAPEEEGAGTMFYKVAYPDGRIAYIEKRIAMPENEWRASLRQDAGSILETARTLMGVPYLWGGTSSKGVDCSGFVRAVFFMHDLLLPRDASQQALAGRRIEIDPDFEKLQPGDLLFFGRKDQVVHVGIYIGDKRFIHSQGFVRINSFAPDHAEYDPYNLNRLLFATRILDAPGSVPGINTTIDNPYYLPQSSWYELQQ